MGSAMWIEAGRTPAASTAFSATGLKPGSEYEFRVIAVNAAGLSDPSEPSNPQMAKARYCKLRNLIIFHHRYSETKDRHGNKTVQSESRQHVDG